MNQGDGREEKGRKSQRCNLALAQARPKGQDKTTCLHRLIQDITTQMFKSVRNQKHPCSHSWRIREPAGLGDACTAAPCSAWTALSTRMGGPFWASHVSSHVTSCEGLPAALLTAARHSLGPSHIMALAHRLLFVFPQWTDAPRGQGLGLPRSSLCPQHSPSPRATANTRMSVE